MDYDSIDLTVLGRNPISDQAKLDSYQLDFQVKCCADPLGDGDDDISYALKPKNIKELTGKSMVPRLLVVVFCPLALDKRMTWRPDRVEMAARGYWANLKGSSKLSVGVKGNGTVRLDRANVFNKNSLHRLMKLASEGESIPERMHDEPS